MVDPKITVTPEGFLVIQVPLKTALKERQESESGKSLLLCSTNLKGFETKEAGQIRISLNVYQRNPAYAEFAAQKNGKDDKEAAEFRAWKASRQAAGVA